MLRAFVPILLLCVSLGFAAAPLEGRVIHVVDGDSLVLLVGDRRLNIRLAQIDAPEQGQRYSIASRQSLTALCGGQLAYANVGGKDRAGRVLAQVTCAGIDANAEQVRLGMAWVFSPGAAPDSPLARLQEEARAARRGLWAQPEPVPPWQWHQYR